MAARGRATKHPCQGIAFGDSLRSGDMSDCEAEWESGLFTIPFSNSNSELKLITSFLELEL